MGLRVSVVTSSGVAAFVGFAGTLALVIQAGDALEATPGQMSLWIAAICISMAVTSAFLSHRFRAPVITAWSTPGAALLAATSGYSMETAIAAFIVVGAMIALTGLIRPLGRLTELVPPAVASGMLAGILLEFCLQPVRYAASEPLLVAPMIVAFLVIRLWTPAASGIVLLLGAGLAHWLGLYESTAVGPGSLGFRELVPPRFHVDAITGIAIPLYLITMASQHLPGMAAISSFGYRVRSSDVLVTTGLASLLSAPFGSHPTNLAAITASICLAEEAHPEHEQRWKTGLAYAVWYLLLAAGSSSIVWLFAALPGALVQTVAGLALVAPLQVALASCMRHADQRFAAATTFVVSSSGVAFFGVGPAFWGLVCGLGIVGLQKVAPTPPRKHRSQGQASDDEENNV